MPSVTEAFTALLGNGIGYARQRGLVPVSVRLSPSFDRPDLAAIATAMSGAASLSQDRPSLLLTETFLPRHVALAWTARKSGCPAIIHPTLTGWAHGSPLSLIARTLLAHAPSLIWDRCLLWPNRWLAPALMRSRLAVALSDLLSRAARPGLSARLLQSLRPERAGAYTPTDRMVIVSADLSAGGAEGNAFYTFLGLREKGLPAEILCFRETTGPQIYKAPGAPIHVLQPAIGGLEKDRIAALAKTHAGLLAALPASTASDVLQCLGWFTRHQPRLVHTWQDYTNIAAGLAAVLAGVPRVVLGLVSVSPIHFNFYRHEMRAIYRALALHPAVSIVANSAAGAREYERWLDLPAGTIAVVYHGLQPERVAAVDREESLAYRASLGIPANAPVVGNLLRFTEVKDPILWLQIAAHVARSLPDTHFLLLGDGEMRAEMQAAAEQLGIAGKLHMPGVTNKPALPLSAMDCLLMTSRQEGLPNTLLEAQALGIPVVTTAVGGAPEALEEGRTGWAVDSRDAAALAARVIDCLGNADWRHQASRRAPDFIRDRFSIDRMVADTIALYRRQEESSALPDNRRSG